MRTPLAARETEILEKALAALPRTGGLHERITDVEPHRAARGDGFGILKWPTSAVCFGPPWVKRTSSLDLSDELGSGGGVGLEMR